MMVHRIAAGHKIGRPLLLIYNYAAALWLSGVPLNTTDLPLNIQSPLKGLSGASRMLSRG